jgi:hypothetical protein
VCVACDDRPEKQISSAFQSVGNDYATGFELRETENGYIIRVNRPWQQATDENFIYKLSREEKQGAIKIPV